MHTIKTNLKLFLIWVLPALLLFFSWVTFGYYFETNDDVAISQVLRGETAVTPITNLHLYFHGLSYLLATLYRVAPTVPWYGFCLYLLLYSSLVLTYQLLVDVLAPTLSTIALVGCLLLVYGLAWQETAVLMNYTRLPILLVGTGLLHLTNRRGHQLSLVIGFAIVALGWCIRPSGAVLGAIVALPGCWWLARWRAVTPVASIGLLLTLLTAIVLTTYSQREQTYRHIDVLQASYWDYQLYKPHPRTTQDSLGILALQNWAYADSTVLNERLFASSLSFDKESFFRQTLSRKVYAAYYMLRENYLWLILFPAIVAVASLIRDLGRRSWEFLAVQVAFTCLLLSLAVGLKLPLRLASPMFSIWTVCTLLYIAKNHPQMLRFTGVKWVVLWGVFGWYTSNLWTKSQSYRYKQARNEAYMCQVYRLARHRTLVVGGVEWAYDYLSPFTTYELSDLPALTLFGWLALDPSVTELRQQLTGTRDFEQSLMRLADDSTTVWLLQDHFVSYLNHYARHHRPQSTLVLCLEYKKSLSASPEFAKQYRATVSARKP